MDIITAADYVQKLRNQGIMISPMAELSAKPSAEEITALIQAEGAVQTAEAEVILACAEVGLPAESLFFDCGKTYGSVAVADGDGVVVPASNNASDTVSGIVSKDAKQDKVFEVLFGKCRFLADRRETIFLLNGVAAPRITDGRLEKIAIRLTKKAGDENRFTEANIPQFSGWIRQSEALTVRGIFLDLRGEADPAGAAKRSFSLIKKIRSDMPCQFSCFCLEGLLEAAMKDQNVENTLKMLAALNDTSLYAKFYIR